MKRFTVLLAPRLERDVEEHLRHLPDLESRGEIAGGYADTWYEVFERTLVGLTGLAERHPYAPERSAWRREVRNALFAEYRILYLVVGEVVWAMRVRHQRQEQLRRAGAGTAYPPSG